MFYPYIGTFKIFNDKIINILLTYIDIELLLIFYINRNPI